MRVPFLSRNMGMVTAVGVFGWFSGSLYERYKNQNQETFQNLPGFPVFGTVSASTPFNTKDDVQNKFVRVQNRTTEIMRYGFPSLDHVRSYDDFVLSFDRRTRVANWVFEHMTADRLKYNKEVDRALCDFTEDSSIHQYFRASNKDYKGSGFDRGHLAAAGNHRLCQNDVQQTFLLTNIAPQVGVGFNRDSWNRLEKYTRKLTKSYENVYVCTGPLYLPYRDPSDGKSYVKYQVLGASQVAVPTHFFKVIVMETKDHSLEMEAYVMPNKVVSNETPLSSFLVPPDVIERNAGLLFFDRVSQEKLVKVNGKKTTYI